MMIEAVPMSICLPKRERIREIPQKLDATERFEKRFTALAFGEGELSHQPSTVFPTHPARAPALLALTYLG